MSNYYLLKKGDFAYNKSYSNGFPLGTVKRLDKYDQGALSSLYIVFRPKKVNTDFLSIYYDTNKWHREVMKLSAEGARNHGLLNIPVNSFFEKNIIIPIHEKEQLEIAKFLKRLEKIIALHQRSFNMLNQKKQVLLRKMFPSLREDIPSIRFNSFEQDWKLSNLGDLGEVLTGNTPSTKMESYWEKGKNGYIWITPSDVFKYKTSESMRYLSEEGWKKARKVPKNSVLITSIASIGKNTINQMPAAFNQQINAIIPKENSAYFILTCMEKNKVQFSSIAGKTATPIINKTDFKKFKVKVPQHPEQLVIGDLFEKIDDILSYYQKKLDVLQKIKSIYLSKMFL
ncbi:restriction endonuclease subunit S [Jeotgalicoccus coquinae]|nr:restriction endonuclease subunit S [Jeotgalicoccus coquinae]CAD2079298.1 EcoKI restriction-modification system protein HsdS [Jeotgalicoccus coquinae]